MNILNKIHTKFDLYIAVSNGYLTDEDAYNLMDKYPDVDPKFKLKRIDFKYAREDYLNSIKELNRKIIFYIQGNNELRLLLATKLSEYFNIKDNKPVKSYITDIADKRLSLNKIYQEYNWENSVIINNYDKNKEIKEGYPYFFKSHFENFKDICSQRRISKNRKLIANYYFLINEIKYEDFIYKITGITDFDNELDLKYSDKEIAEFKTNNSICKRRIHFVIEINEDSNNKKYKVKIFNNGAHSSREEIKEFNLNFDDLNNEGISKNIKNLGNYLLNYYDEFLDFERKEKRKFKEPIIKK